MQLWGFMLLFFLSWTFKVYVMPPVAGWVGILLHAALWLAPVGAYVLLVERRPLSSLGLRPDGPRTFAVGLGIGGAFVAVNWGLRLLLKTEPIVWDLSLEDWIGPICLFPVIEELMFRGLILGRLVKTLPFFAANLLSAILFGAIHIPGWIHANVALWPLIVSIVFVGFICGLAFSWGRSVWAAVIVHAVNNFVSLTIFSL